MYHYCPLGEMTGTLGISTDFLGEITGTLGTSTDLYWKYPQLWVLVLTTKGDEWDSVYLY